MLRASEQASVRGAPLDEMLKAQEAQAKVDADLEEEEARALQHLLAA